MAIKGYLSEITFVELLRIVGNHNGKLIVWNFTEKKQYECYFFNKSVIYLNFCGLSVTAEESVKDLFLELIDDNKSYYAFQDESFAVVSKTPIVSIDELMDFSLFETPEPNDDLLPHLHTRFETVNKVDFELQGALRGFWRDTIKLLHKGCSGYDLCIELSLEEKMVRQNLYKLRTSGLIKPVRMFNSANSLAKSRVTKQNLSRLAGRLSDVRTIQSATNATLPVNGTSAAQDAPTFGSLPLQNVALGGTYFENQNQAELPISTENAAPPSFLADALKDTEVLTKPDG